MSKSHLLFSTLSKFLKEYKTWSDRLNIESNYFAFFCYSVGRPIYQKVMITQNDDEVFIGDAAEKYKGILKLNYPIEHGII